MSLVPRTSTVLAAAIGAILAFGAFTPPPAHADPQARRSSDRQDRDRKSSATKVEQRYPNATREAPKGNATRKTAARLEEMNELYAEEDLAGARAIADSILNDPEANDYEKAYSAQFAAQAAYEDDDLDAAIAYQKQVVELDALDNNGHFGAMLTLAQMQQANEQYEDSIATFDRFFQETASSSPQDLMMKGQALYFMERHAEAAQVMQEAIAAAEEPNPQWQALLMQVFAESGDNAGAIRMAEDVAAARPDDRRALLNLAVVYSQADMMDKAVEVLERLRAGGQLETANEYNQLYVTYLNMEGYERQAAEVINEGLEKGILQADHGTYVALAQAYYFSDQPGPAIEAYRKAAPLDDDGETYLNLAKVLYQEDRMSEAAQAAQQALDRGIKRPDQARDILKAAQ